MSAKGGYPTSSFLSIRTKHIEALERMLNFNNPVDSKTSWQENWKILIYDSFCRDMISTLFKVADLRKHGVTLHLHIEADRQQVLDVSAVYFVCPTTANVVRISKDCSAGLYDSMHLNFSTSISQEELHRLASAVAETDSAERLEKVFDQYMSFISLDHCLFTLQMSDTYAKLNDPNAAESDIESLVTFIVNALFAALVTLQVVPIIRCPRNEAAGMVGERLHRKLRDHLVSTNNLFRDQAYASGTFARPLLAILDRSQDLAVNLQHAWAYDALLHDVLGMSLNKVSVPDPDAPPAAAAAHPHARAKPPKTYDLGAADSFWTDNGGQPFPKVTDEIEARLAAWKQQYDAIAAQGGGGGVGETAGIDALAKAAQRVPELTERKRLLDQHTAICTALLAAITARELDNFYSLETAIVSGQVYNAKSALMQVLSPEAKGSPEDKLRLLVIYLLCTPSLSEAEAGEYAAPLVAQGVDLACLGYLQQLRRMKQLSSRAAGRGGGGGLSLTELMSKLKAGTETATGLLKSVTGGRRELPLTRAVDALMENRGGSGGGGGGDGDDYLYLDPHVHDDGGGARAAARDGGGSAGPRKPFREAVVFVVGGGNYVEHGDLQEMARRTGRNVIYGSTELVTGGEFLGQLARLGRLFAAKS